MSNKTPFEIRADLIKLVTDHAMQQFNANMQLSQEILTKALNSIDLDNKTVNQGLDFYRETMERLLTDVPKFPTFAEIMEQVNQLYGFIGKRD